MGAALRPEAAVALAPRPLSNPTAVGRKRPAGAAVLRPGVQEAPAARGVEGHPGVRSPGDVREGGGVRGDGDAVLQRRLIARTHDPWRLICARFLALEGR